MPLQSDSTNSPQKGIACKKGIARQSITKIISKIFIDKIIVIFDPRESDICLLVPDLSARQSPPA